MTAGAILGLLVLDGLCQFALRCGSPFARLVNRDGFYVQELSETTTSSQVVAPAPSLASFSIHVLEQTHRLPVGPLQREGIDL